MLQEQDQEPMRKHRERWQDPAEKRWERWQDLPLPRQAQDLAEKREEREGGLWLFLFTVVEETDDEP